MMIKEYEWWKIHGRSCRQEQIALSEWYLGFNCFIMGMLFDGHLYISTFTFGAVFYSEAEKFNSTWVSSQSQLLWFSSLHSYHMGVHKIWATRKNGTTDTLVLCYVNWKWKGLAALIGHSRGFTAACMGGKLAFSGFPPLWEEKTGKIAALPLLSSAVNRTFQFSSPPRGGKLAVAALPLL